MWSEVNEKITDGNLGSNEGTGEGIHVKIGVSEIKSAEPIVILSGMNVSEIKEALGMSPLADSCIDAVENGSKKIYCIPVEADQEGSISEVKKTGTSKGTMTISGKPINTFYIFVQIVESGNNNEGTFIYSLDGGKTYSEEYTLPLSGVYEIADVGITLNFADAEDEESSFVAGDVYAFETIAPSTSNKNILDAVETLKYSNFVYEYVHIVGATTEALWSSLGVVADDFTENYHKQICFVTEAYYLNAEETTQQYVDRLLMSAKAFRNKYVQVIAAYAMYIRKDHRTQTINMAGLLTGFYSQASVQESIGKIRKFVVSEEKLLKLMPEGIEVYLKKIEAAGYLVMRQYEGKTGYYAANANMMSPDSSDFKYMEDIRVLNKIVKNVRLKALDEIQEDVDPDPRELEKYIEHLNSVLSSPIEEMEEQGEISGGIVKIDTENLDILNDPEIDVTIEYVPMGKNRGMNISFGVTNAISSEE